jgi:hypothetical protein
MKVDFITQPFLVHVGDIDLFKGKALLEPFTTLHRGQSILTNIIAINKITALCKEGGAYVVEL